MKKLLLTSLSIILLLAININYVAYAVDIEKLVPRSGEKDDSVSSAKNIEKYPEVGNVAKLPELSETALVTETIKLILGWAMLIALIALVAASIYYLTARGKEEDITKAKDITFYLVIGMAIMAAAYGIVVGISQFKFFD